MSFQLAVTANTVPPGTCWPSTFQAGLTAIAANLRVTGIDELSTFVFGPTVPSVDEQSLPWIKTDSNGRLIGLYTFTNGSWQTSPPLVLPGTISDFFGDISGISAPWYICDGSQINGTLSGLLTTPNLSGLVGIGTGTNPATGINYVNQSTGGGTVILTSDNVPAHNHTGNISHSANLGTNASLAIFNDNAAPTPGLIQGGNTTGFAADGVTPNPPLPAPTIPPYMALYKIIFWP